MQKENLFFFSFPSASNLFKVTNKRAKCKRKTCFSLFGVQEFGSSGVQTIVLDGLCFLFLLILFLLSELRNPRTPELPQPAKNDHPFCQDFSKNFDCPKRFDGKSRGEICQFSPLKLPNFSPKFAVKHWRICKPLIFNNL